MQSERDMNFFENIAQEQRKGHYQQQYPPIHPTPARRNNSGHSEPFAIGDMCQEIADKLVEIKKHFSKVIPSREAHKITKTYLDMYAQTQDHGVLEIGLGVAQRLARFTGTLSQLNFQGITRSVPTVISSTTNFSPFGSRCNNTNNLDCLAWDVNIEKYSDLIDPLFRKQSSSLSRTSANSSGVLSSSVPSPASPMRPPPALSRTSQYSPPSSSCYRIDGVAPCQNTKTTMSQTSTDKQQSGNAKKAAFNKNQEYRADPYYSYFGVSREEFEADFLGWQKEKLSQGKKHTVSLIASHPKNNTLQQIHTLSKSPTQPPRQPPVKRGPKESSTGYYTHPVQSTRRNKSRKFSFVPIWAEYEKKFGTEFAVWLKRDPSLSGSSSSPRRSLSLGERTNALGNRVG